MKKYAQKEEYIKSHGFSCKIENCDNMASWEVDGFASLQTYWALCSKHYNEKFEEKTKMRDYFEKEYYKLSLISEQDLCSVENCYEFKYYEFDNKKRSEFTCLSTFYVGLCEQHYNEHFNNLEGDVKMKKFNIKDYKKSDFIISENMHKYCLNCQNLWTDYDLYNEFIEYVSICKNCYDTLKSEPFEIIEGQTTCIEAVDNFREMGFKKIWFINKDNYDFTRGYNIIATLKGKKILKFMAQGKLLVCIVED